MIMGIGNKGMAGPSRYLGKHSEEDSLEVKSHKIDADGKYLPYSGFTIVSMLTDRLRMAGVFDYIKSTKSLSKYLAPLPISSYHVTLLDLFTQQNVPEKYRPQKDSVEPKQQWSDALETDMLELQKVCDSMRGPIAFKISNAKFIPVQGSVLYVVGTLTNEEEVARVRNQLTSLLKVKDANRVFHLTLGYVYRKVDPGDLPGIDQELAGLGTLLESEYTLEQPNVCHFESMEEFIPFKSRS